MRSLKSFKTFLSEQEFYANREIELAKESKRNKKWRIMNESAEVGWGEFEMNDTLYDSYMKTIIKAEE